MKRSPPCRIWLAALASVLASACATQADRFEGLQGFADTRYEAVAATATGHRYDVFIRLPETYDEQPGKAFPVVYLLDGGAMFPKLSGYYHYLRLGEELPEMMLVGISYGTDDFAEGNYRASDFTAPAADRDYWGDAPQFQRFLADELIPSLESRYRMRADRRVLFGQSLGAQFVLYSALSAPQMFWGRIASNPALHRNLDYFLHHELPPPASDSMLFVASGEFDAAVFRKPTLEWVQSMSARPSLPWRLRSVTLTGESHFSAAPAAFRQGLSWFFADSDQPDR